MKTIRAVTCAVALMLAWPVMGDLYTGNKLMDWCDETATVLQNTYCAMYLSGIMDAESAFVGWKVKTPHFCIPDGVSVNQVRQVFLQYMKAYPEDWHMSAGSLALNAFRQAWPCSSPLGV